MSVTILIKCSCHLSRHLGKVMPHELLALRARPVRVRPPCGGTAIGDMPHLSRPDTLPQTCTLPYAPLRSTNAAFLALSRAGFGLIVRPISSCRATASSWLTGKSSCPGLRQKTSLASGVEMVAAPPYADSGRATRQ